MVVMKEIDDERFYIQVGEVLGAASQSLEEAYMTEVRVRLAERGARAFLERRMATARQQAQSQT